ncbi:MAG: hypothetical protein HC769_06040 [Cyanobacteria bacterium CRU_2_1]|nr:hypothetical protein [Cyanobacteria bacterium RU_5_0]NJR58449.1 hypothetical protein [Cyanobacteria bacterium CRU_2_1]
MNLPVVLDITLGLVFIYLILSLLASEIQEVITTFLQWRAAHLKKSIEILLSGDSRNQTSKIASNSVLSAENSTSRTPLNLSDEEIAEQVKRDTQKVEMLVESIYNDPLLRNISQHSRGGIESALRWFARWVICLGGLRKRTTLKNNTEPSYIPSETFATTLLERLELSQIADKLTTFNIQVFTEYEIVSEIKSYINDLKVSQKSRDLLLKDARKLAGTFSTITAAFDNKKLPLLTTVYLLRDTFQDYVEKYQAKVGIQPKPSAQEEDDSQEKSNSGQIFVEQLMSLKKNIFYDSNTNYNNIDEIVRRLQPSLDQVLDFFKTDAESIEAFLKEKVGTEEVLTVDQNSEIYKTYEKIKSRAEIISSSLPSSVRMSLAALARRAQINLKRVKGQTEIIEAELKQFKAEIQKWFDRSMDRTSGVYKRNAKGVAFLIGFFIAWAVNADTFHIASRLATDEEVRSALVTRTEELLGECPIPTPDQSPGSAISPTSFLPGQPALAQELPPPAPEVSPLSEPGLPPVPEVPSAVPSPSPVAPNSIAPSRPTAPLDCLRQVANRTVPLPIGWDRNNLRQQLEENNSAQTLASSDPLYPLPRTPRMLLGWVVSGIAISMGASFWFDLLSKVMNVRNSGKAIKEKAPNDSQ